jgi:hypothetical protein
MYDVLILSVNQKEPSLFQSNEIISLALNQDGECRPKYYQEIWPFINNTYGILYKTFAKGEFFASECGDDLFDFDYDKNNEINVPEFYADSRVEVAEDLISFSVTKECKGSFVSLLQQILFDSPTKTLMFLCRGQSQEKEIVLGVIPFERFLEMLINGNVCTNICYVISN